MIPTSRALRLVTLAVIVAGAVLAILFVLDIVSVWALELSGVLVLLGIAATALMRPKSVDVSHESPST